MSHFPGIISAMICEQFAKEFPNETRNNKQTQGMLVSFALSLSEKKNGYLDLEMFVFAPSTYVQVWVRKHRQTDKSERNSAWKRVACHDSAWRSDGVNDTLYKYAEKINFINMGSCWYELIGADKLKVPYKR